MSGFPDRQSARRSLVGRLETPTERKVQVHALDEPVDLHVDQRGARAVECDVLL